MLSRTAENLYWLSRYFERAENLARLLDVGLRMSALSREAGTSVSEWHSTIVAAGCEKIPTTPPPSCPASTRRGATRAPCARP
jgi:uncharacterized alpha-E superfamily protein